MGAGLTEVGAVGVGLAGDKARLDLELRGRGRGGCSRSWGWWCARCYLRGGTV